MFIKNCEKHRKNRKYIVYKIKKKVGFNIVLEKKTA